MSKKKIHKYKTIKPKKMMNQTVMGGGGGVGMTVRKNQLGFAPKGLGGQEMGGVIWCGFEKRLDLCPTLCNKHQLMRKTLRHRCWAWEERRDCCFTKGLGGGGPGACGALGGWD